MQTVIHVAGVVLAVAWIVVPACFLLAVVASVLGSLRRKEEGADAPPSRIDPTQPASL